MSSYRCLGVLFDPSLNVKDITSAVARIKFLKRMKQSRNSHAAESILCGLNCVLLCNDAKDL